jgi:outer membrane protein OmpA-like peptidoglycan-associated protein
MIRRRLWALCLGVTLAGPANAQIVGRPFEFSGQAGWNRYDVRARVQDGPGFGGALGWRVAPWLVLEGQASFGPSDADTVPKQKHNFFSTGLDARLNLRPGEGRVVPYFLLGAGYASSHTSGHPPDKLARGSGSIGLGLLHSLRGSPRTYLRLQVRDVFFRERDALEFSNHLAASVGLHYVWGGKPHDSDLDGVRDWYDHCPSTPIGAKVDASGCPHDSDGDKVLDGLDRCEGTPAGCTVDKNGCPSDADGDGVCDGVDQCAGSQKGASVDAKGCTSDADADSVPDGIDQCADTPKGCTPDAKGCPSDADGDGVCDGLDLCANTPQGVRVDASGCPVDVGQNEVDLLDTGTIRLYGIVFDRGKATLQPKSLPALEEAAKVIQQYPSLQIEIGDHADNQGGASAQELSEERATAVLEHLKQSSPQLSSAQLTAKGYGSSRPIAPNTSELGRSKNRRIELRVLNPSALKKERDKRRPRRGENLVPAPAPADTTKK